MKLRRIQKIVAMYFGLSLRELLSDRKFKKLTRARHIAMGVARDVTHYSFPELGRLFGGRDHATVIHGYRKYSHMRDQGDPDALGALEAVRSKLEVEDLPPQPDPFVAAFIDAGVRKPEEP